MRRGGRKSLRLVHAKTLRQNPVTRCTMPVRAKDDKLFFDFFWNGIRCKEYTGLADNGENRRLCERKMSTVHAAIKRGTFDYRAHFPRGSRLHLFHPDLRERDGAVTLFADYLR